VTTPTVASTLKLANGFAQDEFESVVAALGRLDERLRSFRDDAVELQLSVKERGTSSQKTTIEAWIAGQPRLVATSTQAVLEAALIEVRDELIRQITDAKNRTEPRNSRQRRTTL
jgi:ribosome-associated translation inhibitor RaiA